MKDSKIKALQTSEHFMTHLVSFVLNPLFATLISPLLFQCARRGARCDYALYAGAGPDNAEMIAKLGHAAAGLKMYLNDTYSTLKMPDLTQWMQVY